MIEVVHIQKQNTNICLNSIDRSYYNVKIDDNVKYPKMICHIFMFTAKKFWFCFYCRCTPDLETVYFIVL